MKTLLVWLLLFPLLVSSQSGIVFESKTINMGNITDFNNTPAVFSIVNNGTQRAAVLAPPNHPFLKIITPQGYINPGERAAILVYYRARNAGDYSESFQLFTSNSDTPITLTIKGKIINTLDCPTWDQKPIPTTQPREILIINATTKAPIPNADLNIQHQTGRFSGKSNGDGKWKQNVPMGSYPISISKEKFIPLEQLWRVNRESTSFVFELIPINEPTEPETAPIKLPEEEIVQQQDTIFIPKNTTEQESPLMEEDIPPNNPMPVSETNTNQNQEEIVVQPVEEPFVELPPSPQPVMEQPIAIEEQPTEIQPPQNNTFNDTTQDENPVTIKPTLPVNHELLPADKYAFNNLIFLIDISASMKGPNRLVLLKKAMNQMVDVLRANDKITIITYAQYPTICLEAVSGMKKDTMHTIIDSLIAGGGTYGVRGLQKAYDIAHQNFITNGNNQILLSTDGEFNSPDFSDKELMTIVKTNAQKGIKVSVIGFGTDTEAQTRMKNVVKNGNGNYIHIQRGDNVNDILIEEIKKNSLITRAE